ncbi:MAG: rod shape-determining protein RodA [Bacteroidales bacterium]|nr:rod shape-determining protein RodA [Bacteroidales bacterium]
MREQKNISFKIDWLLILLYVLIVGLGYLNLYSSDYQASVDGTSFIDTTFGRQLIWIAASFFIAFIIMLVDTVVFSMFSYVFYVIVLSILFLVFVFGVATHGARSWLEIGDFKIQPSEFAKFATALALSRFISVNGFKLKFNNLLNIAISVGIVFFPILLILLQPDVGSAMVYVAFIFVFYREGLPGIVLWYIFLMTVIFVLALVVNLTALILAITIVSLVFLYFELKNKKHIVRSVIVLLSVFSLFYFVVVLFSLKFELTYIILVSISVWTIYMLISFAGKRQPSVIIVIGFLFSGLLVQFMTDIAFHKILQPHQRSRIEVLFDNTIDPKGIGYNLRQSKIAIGSGGAIGKGFLKGTQTKLDFVPEHNTDFIFCTVAEEWGFRGTVAFFILYAMLLFRIVFKAEKQISPFSRIYGYSVVSILFIHFFVNIGMTIGLLPVIGIPLPFFSYGGSAMLGFTVLLFIFIKLDTEKDLKL